MVGLVSIDYGIVIMLCIIVFFYYNVYILKIKNIIFFCYIYLVIMKDKGFFLVLELFKNVVIYDSQKIC